MRFLFVFCIFLQLGLTGRLVPQQLKFSSQQAVLIQFHFGSRDIRELHEFEEKLHTLLTNKPVGEYDGHDISADGSDAVLYFYGPNAKKLFNHIRPILQKAPFLRKAKAKLRFGSADDKNPRIEIRKVFND